MNDPILDMAKDLGYAIQQDERFIKTQLAQTAADEDEALQTLIGEFNLKRIAINNESHKEEKDGEKLKQLDEELRAVYAQIMENPHMAAYNEAKTALDKLVHDLGTILTLSAQGQDPEGIDLNGCGGNCSGCSGCH